MVTSRISRPQVTPAPEETSLDALVQISFHVMGILSQVAAEHDLSLTQLRVLAILRDHEPTMSELADHLGLDRSSVSGLIDRAEKRGLVCRIASDVDKRSSRVTLTKHGQAFAAEGLTVVAARTSHLTADLSAADQRALGRVLRHVPSGSPGATGATTG